MAEPLPPRSPALGWGGLVLCLLALVALAVPGPGYVRALRDDGVRLDTTPVQVDLPTHRTYGVYVDDADNSGYSEQCTAVDRLDGQGIQMKGPSWSISSSDTENLDMVFDTGSGQLALSCSVPGESVSVRPVPDHQSMLIAGVLAAVLGFVGGGMLLGWAVIRFARRSPAAGGGVVPDAP